LTSYKGKDIIEYISYFVFSYGKNKDAFGWPDDNEECAQCPTTSLGLAQNGQDKRNEDTNIEK
jgi:hypothetical protein